MSDAFTPPNLPRLLASVACDDVAFSERDGRISMQRIFFDVGATAFPANLERLAVVNIWTGGEGAYQTGAALVSPDGVEISRGELDLEARPDRITNIHLLNLDNVVLPKPGVYEVKVFLQGAEVHAFDFLVADISGLGERELEPSGLFAELLAEAVEEEASDD